MSEQSTDRPRRDSPEQPARRPYTRPVLTEFGSVASLTAGTMTRQSDGPGGGFKRPA